MRDSRKNLKLVLGVSLATIIGLTSSNASAKSACSTELVEKILATSQQGPAMFAIACDLTLPAQSLVRGNLIFQGAAASGVTLDCNGGTIDATEGANSTRRTAITVRSAKTADNTWAPPRNVTVKNCNIRGSVRLYGMDQNTNGPVMRESSFSADHTARAQAAAPSDITFSKLQMTARDAVVLYVGAGVTRMTLTHSTIDGEGASTAIYLDAESSENLIEDNVFLFRSSRREVLAIDGSSRNKILGNTFKNVEHGGIFVYRNCGEGGVIRHQRPEYNRIERNTFDLSTVSSNRGAPVIWLGSRQGRSSFCFFDPAHPFGSSANPMDFARHNTVNDNVFLGRASNPIRDSDQDNDVGKNSFR